jgi:hypothetical protein
VPIVKITELIIRPVRRPSHDAMGDMRKQPKKAPPWRMETALELIVVFCALVWSANPKSRWKESSERTPPVERTCQLPLWILRRYYTSALITPVSNANANEPMQLAATRYIARTSPSFRPISSVGRRERFTEWEQSQFVFDSLMR